MTTIIGIDPGSRTTGYGIIRHDSNQSHYISCGTIKPISDDLSTRLYEIHQGLSEVIQTHKPSQASVEQVFMQRNVASALKLGQARGSILVVCAYHALPVAEFSAREIKKSIVGHGGAEKSQVQQMVKRLLNLSQIPSHDAADALAVALCFAHTQAYRKLLAKTEGIV